MRIALLADIHSNLEALAACLRHAQAAGAERFAFLGDLVGYGADPEAVLDIVMERASRGARVVLGNHDQAVAGHSTRNMNPAAERAVEWTRRQLRGDQAAFLAALPLTAREGDCFYVHASADAPQRWTYVSDSLRAAHSMDCARSPYTFGGHVHEQRLYFQGADRRPQPFQPTPGSAIPVPRHRRWLAIVGSCGQPRDGDTAACYAMLDAAEGELVFHRVPYDHASAAHKIRRAGLPERLASRLEHGR
jgi:diadenosine tetraphosphatase ApaH/serine/threonine PP2A family protein phosphatase